MRRKALSPSPTFQSLQIRTPKGLQAPLSRNMWPGAPGPHPPPLPTPPSQSPHAECVKWVPKPQVTAHKATVPADKPQEHCCPLLFPAALTTRHVAGMPPLLSRRISWCISQGVSRMGVEAGAHPPLSSVFSPDPLALLHHGGLLQCPPGAQWL